MKEKNNSNGIILLTISKSTKNCPTTCVGEFYIGFFINILDQLDDKDQIYLIYHQNQCLHVIHTLNYLQ